MFYRIIFFIIIVGIVWVFDINIIRSIADKIYHTDNICRHTDVVLIRYEKHLTKNVIIGKTSWGDLCSINDLDKEFEDFVYAHLNEKVRVYYKSIHRGVFLFSESNQVTSMIPVYKKNR